MNNHYQGSLGWFAKGTHPEILQRPLVALLSYLSLKKHSGLEINDLVPDPGLKTDSPWPIANVAGDGLEHQGTGGQHELIDVPQDLGRLVSIG